jgi:paraquat-inducible protein A
MKDDLLLACHECDLLHRIKPLPEGQTAVCSRCGAELCSHKRDSFERSLALTLAGLILFIMANAYPLLDIKQGSLFVSTTLIGSVEVLYATGMWYIGLLVLLTAILFPFLQLMSMLIILVPLQMKKKPWKLPVVMKFLEAIKPWGMMEVFMLGILVSIVKLVKMVKVIPGHSLVAFAVLIFVLAALVSAFDTHQTWETMDGDR